MGICDKCGKEVDVCNNAVLIDSYAYDNPVAVFVFTARHFFPTEDCEGSPSRAQYIEGQSPDTRPNAQYDPELEQVYRTALAQVKEEADKARG